jgi:hypothetical protein
VGKVQYVEDRGESGVEHAVLDQDCYLDVGNAINPGVSATYSLTGPRLASWCTGQTPVRLGIEPAPQSRQERSTWSMKAKPGKGDALAAALLIELQPIAVPPRSEPPIPPTRSKPGVHR